jgi:hypothetical protein
MTAYKQKMRSNRFVLAAMAGTLVWFADQPTVRGYNPLLEMFWDTGFWKTPSRDHVVLLLSWLVTTLFLHFVLFALEKVRRREYKT